MGGNKIELIIYTPVFLPREFHGWRSLGTLPLEGVLSRSVVSDSLGPHGL